MKISVRLFLLTFIIIAFVSVAYTYFYYTTTNSLLHSQHIKYLQTSSGAYISYLESQFQNAKVEDTYLKSALENKKEINFTKLSSDFLFEATSVDTITNFHARGSSIKKTTTISKFLKENDNLVIWELKFGNRKVYYGKKIDTDLIYTPLKLSSLGIALIVEGKVVFLSEKDTKYVNPISKAYNILRAKKNNEIFIEKNSDTDLIVSYYKLRYNQISPSQLGVIIFSHSDELKDFRSTMFNLIVVIVITIILLTLIFVILYTEKIRKQINLLSEISKIAAHGNYTSRVNIITNDEIGQLGITLNKMFDEIEKKHKTEKDYSEFLSFLNKSPGLEKICLKSLEKISDATSFHYGIIYLVNNGYQKVTAKGLENIVQHDLDLLEEIKITKKSKQIFTLQETTKRSIQKLKKEVKEIAFFPVIYGNEVIAILELGATEYPDSEEKLFINNIIEQLAVGIANSLAHKKLEETVEELTSLNENYKIQNKELTNLHLELNRQKDKAQELTKAKSEFLANITHDLKTPLNSVIGLTELMYSSQEFNLDTKNKLSIIIRNAKKLLYLINNILEFSKSETGNINYNETEFWLNDFIEQINFFIAPLALEKNIEYIYNTQRGKDYLIRCDINLLEQVLINLLTNAVKYTDKGRVVFKIEVLEKTINFIIEDSGIGIAEEDKTKIFDEYQRIDIKTTKQQGTGLGLSICKRYTDIMKGKISFKSELGKGTTFNLELRDGVVNMQTPVEDINCFLLTEYDDSFNLYSNYLSEKEISSIKIPQLSENMLNDKSALIIFDMDSSNALTSFENYLKNDNSSIFLPFIINRKNFCAYMLFIHGIIHIPTTEKIKKIIQITEERINKKIRIAGFINNSGLNTDFDISDESITNFYSYNKVEINNLIENDILFLTINHDTLNGLDLLYELKKIKNTREIPVVLLINFLDFGTFFQEMKEKINEIAMINKYHPLDTLQVILKLLNLDEGKHISEKLIIDENDEKNISQDAKKPKKNILIVDDDKDTLFTVNEIVKSLGIETLLAENGKECLDILNTLTPDLVLLDIMMPIMDGFETIKRIRENSKFNNIPVVAMTAYAMLDNRDVLIKKGFNAIITKPIILSDFTKTIDEMLTKSDE